VDSVGAPPRALSIWDALLGPSRRGEIIGSREPERHIRVGGSRPRPMADQLLVRTGEMVRRQEEGPNRKIFGAMARYLPALSGMRLL
jgi:hypothetical protein